MPLARIYLPTKNAMQSGKSEKKWRLEYVPETPYFSDPLMGWTGMADTVREIRLHFSTLEQAVAYAKEHSLTYEVEEPTPSSQTRKAYADNFSFSKVKD